MMVSIGRFMVFFGFILVLVGFGVQLVGKLPGVGRLPGDILIRKGDFTFYFPLATGLIVSLVLSLLFTIFTKR